MQLPEKISGRLSFAPITLQYAEFGFSSLICRVWLFNTRAAVTFGFVVWLSFFINTFASAASDESDAPIIAQPIDFPHSRHAGSIADGGNEINCLYCHSYARRSPVAGIPTLAKCMGCHRYVGTDKEEIKKLTAYWESNTPIAWKKVHDLPDFVYFSHERHVQRFVFQSGQSVQQVCGYCHGDVKTMEVAVRQRSLSMGWCLSCHKQFQDKTTGAPAPAKDWIIGATDKPITAPFLEEDFHNAPSDCWECHK